MKKILSSLSILLLVLSIFSHPLNVNAQEMNYVDNLEDANLIEKEELAIGGVAIFLGGVLVGYLVDGVIQYTTGHSSADWVELGLEHVEDWVTAQTYPDGYYIKVTENGHKTVCNPQNYCQGQLLKIDPLR